jgi:hypothetical protein
MRMKRGMTLAAREFVGTMICSLQRRFKRGWGLEKERKGLLQSFGNLWWWHGLA